MRTKLIIITLAIVLFSCKQRNGDTAVTNNIQLLIPDTTQNIRAKTDLDDLLYRSKLEKQIGLTDLRKGADSLEVRLWYSFSFDNKRDLYIVRVYDTSYLLSYYRVYPRTINFDDENRNRAWDPYTDPILDSVFSATVQLNKNAFAHLYCDSLWLLKSCSELPIPDSVGFTDCSSYILEIADARRFKYLRYHCPSGYYEKTRLKEIEDFDRSYYRIMQQAFEHHLNPFVSRE